MVHLISIGPSRYFTLQIPMITFQTCNLLLYFQMNNFGLNAQVNIYILPRVPSDFTRKLSLAFLHFANGK